MEYITDTMKSVGDAVKTVSKDVTSALSGGMRKTKHHKKTQRRHHKKGGSSCGTYKNTMMGGMYKKRKHHTKKGGNMLAKAAVPFGLLGLQRVLSRNNRRTKKTIRTRKMKRRM